MPFLLVILGIALLLVQDRRGDGFITQAAMILAGEGEDTGVQMVVEHAGLIGGLLVVVLILNLMDERLAIGLLAVLIIANVTQRR